MFFFLNYPLSTIPYPLKIMFRALFLILGIGVVLAYSSASWFGWEFANSGSNSRLGMPFIYGGGFRGGK